MDRPHIALLESVDDIIFYFFLSQPSEERRELQIENLENVEDNTVVEVRYSSSDYRYYRRNGGMWMTVAEMRNPFFMEVYEDGSCPVPIQFPDDRLSISD